MQTRIRRCTRRRLFLYSPFLLCVACAAPGEPGRSDPRLTQEAHAATIQGLVLGYTPTGNDTWTTEPVGGTAVEYMSFTLPAGDSVGGVGPVLGQVTADAEGRFTIGGIAGGWYALRFTPPAGSPYEGGLRKINTEEHPGLATFSLLRR